MNSTPVLKGPEAWSVMERGGTVAVYLPFINETTHVKYRMERDKYGRKVYMTNIFCTNDEEMFRPCKANLNYFLFTDAVFVEVEP